MKASEYAENNIDIILEIVQYLIRDGEFDKAEEVCRKNVNKFKESVELKLFLVECFIYQEKKSAASVLLEDLLEDNHSAPVLKEIATYLFEIGEIDKARNAYLNALDQDDSVFEKAFADKLGIKQEKVKISTAPFEEYDESETDYEMEVRQELLDKNILQTDISLSFKDVGGLDEIKDTIRMNCIYPKKYPELFKTYDKTIGGSMLLYGPPGCGKSLVAYSAAGESKHNFMSVSLHDILDMYQGQTETKLHQIFEIARSNNPCIILFDEIDAICAKRSDKNSAGKYLIHQFLAELDGFQQNNEGVYIISTTSSPWLIDPSFKRPGRLNDVFFVPPPNALHKEKILSILLHNKPVATSFDVTEVSESTPHYSGADLKYIVDQIVNTKLSEALKTGNPTPINNEDFRREIQLYSPTTLNWLQQAKEIAAQENDNGFYNPFLSYMDLPIIESV